MAEKRYLTVSALTKYLKRKFEMDSHLQNVFLKGELSNVKIHNRGHIYFTIKDEQARIQAVMFAGQNRNLKFTPENGMKVLIQGDLSVYEPQGQYQIYVQEMQPDGIGQLYMAYEQLKKKLEFEGLFADEQKKQLPLFPEKVGIVTSPTGAAIRDIIITIKRRYPTTSVVIYPALVQGKNAGPTIVEAIDMANNQKEVDVLIIGRGGGSIEELWAFNEEQVARAIYRSSIPIISAVGHETDFTIADFVADVRAPTPTAAAELAVPHYQEVFERITQRKLRIIRAMREKTTAQQDKLKSLQKSYAFRYPERLLHEKEQDLDQILIQLNKEIKRLIDQKKESHYQVVKRLQPKFIINEIERKKDILGRHTQHLSKEISNTIKESHQKFQQIINQMEALSPLRVMQRGYSIAYNEGEIIKTINKVNLGDKVSIRLQDGTLACNVLEIEEREK